MARLRPTTRHERDLLVRRPWLDEPTPSWCPAFIDVIDQLEELAVMFRRGLLSRDEFDRQKRNLLSG